MTEIAKLLPWLKERSPLFFLAFGVATGLLLFAPPDFLRTTGLAEFVDRYRGALGGVLLTSIVGLIVSAVLYVAQVVTNWHKGRRQAAERHRRLKSLTPEERRLLARFFVNQSKTQVLAINDGLSQGLVHARIIYLSAGLMSEGYWEPSFAHNIQPWAWDYLQTRQNLLEPELSELRAEREE
jgi:hypothetical protein